MTNNFDNVSVDDFVKVCRTCLAFSAPEEMKNLYENCTSDECLLEMLMAVTFVQFTENDHLPFQICLNCENEIIRSYKFAQKCLEVDKRLKKCFTNHENHRKTIVYSSETLQIIPSQENQIEIKQEIETEEEVAEINFETCLIKTEDEQNEDDIDRFDENISQSENGDEISETKQEKVLKTPKKRLGPPYECKKCYQTFATTKLLWIHYKQVKHPPKSRIACKICSKSVQCSKMSMHMKIHSSEQAYGCNICTKRFRTKANLTRHEMIHTGEKPHKCPHCYKAFIQLTTLRHHMLTHTGEKPYICDHCGSSFASRGSLNTHLKNRRGDICYKERRKPGRPPGTPNPSGNSSGKYECDICHRKYHTKPLLTQHKLIHGAKNFLCSFCGRGFCRQMALDSHLKVHTGVKPYTCETCGKKFSQAGSLSTHKLVHTGDKPFVCKICDRRFTQRHHVVYHMRTHSGEKPHICTVCGKSFALNGNLKVHIRTHTGETPYLCPICGKGFYDSSSMKKHKLACDKQNKKV